MFTLKVKKPSSARTLPKLKRFRKRAKPNILRAFTEIAVRAERQVKAVDLSRGGGFRITKTSTGSGARRGPATPKWRKNTSPYPRIGNGTLRSSWRSSPAKVRGPDVESKITSDVVYARIIDMGGWAGRGRTTWLKGWPYIKTMLRRNRSRFLQIAGRRVFSGFSGA